MRIAKFVLPAIAAGALVLAGCSSADTAAAPSSSAPGAAASSSPAAASDATFNDADVAFLTGMYPHHAQAVEMTALVASRTTNPDVLALSAQIEGAQQPEMDQMAALLKAWGQPAPSAAMEPGNMDHSSMGHGGGSSMEGMEGMEGMAGMMTPEQMAQLEGLSGAEFDTMWMEMMIEHHLGAVAMAQTAIDSGESPEVAAMSAEIIAGQEAEIAHMRGLLG